MRLGASWNNFTKRGQTWDHFWQDAAGLQTISGTVATAQSSQTSAGAAREAFRASGGVDYLYDGQGGLITDQDGTPIVANGDTIGAGTQGSQIEAGVGRNAFRASGADTQASQTASGVGVGNRISSAAAGVQGSQSDVGVGRESFIGSGAIAQTRQSVVFVGDEDFAGSGNAVQVPQAAFGTLRLVFSGSGAATQGPQTEGRSVLAGSGGTGVTTQAAQTATGIGAQALLGGWYYSAPQRVRGQSRASQRRQSAAGRAQTVKRLRITGTGTSEQAQQEELGIGWASHVGVAAHSQTAEAAAGDGALRLIGLGSTTQRQQREQIVAFLLPPEDGTSEDGEVMLIELLAA